MSGLRSWLRGAGAGGSSSAPSSKASSIKDSAASSRTALEDPVAREVADLEDALTTVELIMNDDIEGAEAALNRPNPTSFHELGLGVAVFLRAVLGFEKDIMAEAATRLVSCENHAWADMKKAQSASSGAGGGGGWFGRSATTTTSTASTEGGRAGIYSPGVEYALVHAQAQLMNAIVAVLHETLTEALKGFYKLRKAFITLDGIMAEEEKAASGVTLTTTSNKVLSSGGNGSASKLGDGETEKSLSRLREPEIAKLSLEDGPTSELLLESPSFPDTPSESRPQTPAALGEARVPLARSDTPELTNTIDVFIHSGVTMCFGILLVVMSLVPPAFSRLLYLIGFKGDRQRGLRMLWQSSKYTNINGAVAGLMLLGYYNALIGFADILPTQEDIDAPRADGGDHDEDLAVVLPRERGEKLLADMRARYPDSGLWKLEEARMLANRSQLREAIATLQRNGDSRMRQVTALSRFELSINAMFCLDWPLVAQGFLQCIELNNWSHALYYYIAGAAEVEMYRDAVGEVARLKKEDEKDTSTSELLSEAESRVRRHKEAADKYIRKAPAQAGKKKFMAKQMPFEVFVARKVGRWEERAKELGVDLVDAIGPSPGIEMIILWGGNKRMHGEVTERALAALSWDRCTASSVDALHKIKTVDECGVRDVCEASMLRAMGRFGESKELLGKVLQVERTAFKGPGLDDYVQPLAHYELAVIHWKESSQPEFYPTKTEENADADADAVANYRRKKLDETAEQLDAVAKWETFVLDARIGMRVQTALNTISWLKKKNKWM